MTTNSTPGVRAIGRPLATAKRALFELRPEWQARHVKTLDLEHVEQLVAVLEEGGELPPLSVVKMTSGALAVVDGYHRFAAYVERGVDRLPFEVVGEGDACILWHLAHANSQHGRGRDIASKRESVRLALAAPEGGDMSTTGIARWCGVSEELVRSVRAETLGAPSAAAERKQRVRAEIEADPGAPPSEIAKRAGVDRKTARKAIAAEGGENAGHRRSPHLDPEVPSRPEPAITDAAELPFETPLPEWQAIAVDCDAVANGILTLRRAHAHALKRIPGGQELVDLLVKAHGIATRRKPHACPAPHDGATCPVCDDRGYTLGPAGNWQAIVDAARVAHA